MVNVAVKDSLLIYYVASPGILIQGFYGSGAIRADYNLQTAIPFKFGLRRYPRRRNK